MLKWTHYRISFGIDNNGQRCAAAITGTGFPTPMNLFVQAAKPTRGRTFLSLFRHLGAFGLFALTILDSSPLPTFGGPDILLAILVATRRNPWYEYAVVATLGSTIGAYITFRLARQAGQAYLDGKFGQSRVARFMEVFQKWGTGSLVASSAVPFPFPTSLVFAAAGASDYHLGRFLVVVAASRGFRYAAIAILADHYGRRIAGIFRHPTQYWGWLLFFAALILALIGAGLLIRKRVVTAPAH